LATLPPIRVSACPIIETQIPLLSRTVEGTQDSMISMMRRYIFAQYPHSMAVKLFSGLLHCIADLQELTWCRFYEIPLRTKIFRDFISKYFIQK
jgi:hypothetical protein